jgi:hypothetical protein
MDAGPTDAGRNDAGADDAGPSDAGPEDAGPTDAGITDAGVPDGGDHGFSGFFIGSWTETLVNKLDGGELTDGGFTYLTVRQVDSNRITVRTACGCDSPCEFSAVTPDDTNFIVELERPYSCDAGPCTTTTITSGWGTRRPSPIPTYPRGWLLNLQLEGVQDSTATDECEEGHFIYERIFSMRTFSGG